MPFEVVQKLTRKLAESRRPTEPVAFPEALNGIFDKSRGKPFYQRQPLNLKGTIDPENIGKNNNYLSITHLFRKGSHLTPQPAKTKHSDTSQCSPSTQSPQRNPPVCARFEFKVHHRVPAGAIRL